MRVGNRDISACHPARDERGYAMVVLLVSLAVMAVMMSVAMPVWKQVSQREKETELAFRGEQYARAIGLFQRKNGPGTLPPSIDALVEQRFLRKKYKDPITNNDFVPLLQGAATQQGVGTGQTPAGGTGRGGFNQPNLQQGRGGTPTGGTASSGAFGGVRGVASKSKEKSIRLYKGRNHYNEWEFVYTPPAQPPGSGPNAAGPGGQRGRGNQNPPGDGRGRGFSVSPDGRFEPSQPFGPNAPGGPRGTGPSPQGR